MAIVRLGRNILRWCGSCNIPIIEEKTCPICKSTTTEILLTPPGDCRPAFDYDIVKIRELADRQFGNGCGELLLPRDRIAVLSRSPALDRMDEIVCDGETIGALMFDPPSGDRLILRLAAAEKMLPKSSTAPRPRNQRLSKPTRRLQVLPTRRPWRARSRHKRMPRCHSHQLVM